MVFRDITDARIKALHNVNKEDSNTKGMLSDQCLKNAIIYLLGASMDTTSSFLTWSFLYLAAFPEVQVKIHQHLDDVIGRDCKIRFQDSSSLPYLEATLSEIMRRTFVRPPSVFFPLVQAQRDVLVRCWLKLRYFSLSAVCCRNSI